MKRVKTTVLSLLLGCTPLLIQSCNRMDIHEDGLEVSTPQEGLSFEWNASEAYDLKVTSSNSQWEFICQAEWLQIDRQIDRLIISPTANNGLEERRAQITIVAGNDSKTVDIVQKARGVYFDSGNSEFSVPHWSASETLYIKSNIEGWIAESNADWLRVVAAPHLKQLQVTIAANRAPEERTAQIAIKSATTSEVIETLSFKQAAVVEYLLPFFHFGESSRYADVEALELARRSEIVLLPTRATSSTQSDQPYYEFRTQSDLFPRVKYQPKAFGNTFIFKTVLVARNKEVFEAAAYKEFMAKEGFVETSNTLRAAGRQVVYVNTSKKVKAVEMALGSTNEIVFFPVLDNIPTHATISQVYGLEQAGMYGTATPEEVEAWEITQGGKRDELWCNTLTTQLKQKIELYHHRDPLFTKWYFFKPDANDSNKQKIDEVRYMMSNFRYGFYQYGDMLFVNPAFDALLRQNGFVVNEGFIEPHKNYHTYDNRSKNLRLVMLQARWNKMDVFAYHMFKINP